MAKSEQSTDLSINTTHELSSSTLTGLSLGNVSTHDDHLYHQDEIDTDAAIESLRPSQSDIQHICAPAYDAARLFLVAQDLRPLDLVPSPTFLSSVKLECGGLDKRSAFSALSKALMLHLNDYLPDTLSARAIGAQDLRKAMTTLIEALNQHEDVIGMISEERFVIGNDNRPKITPEEASVMRELQVHIQQLVRETKRYKEGST